MKAIVCAIFLLTLSGAVYRSPPQGIWDSKAPFLEFVTSIQLAEPPEFPPKSYTCKLGATGTPPDDKKEGCVVGGGITAFTQNVKGLSKQDILDATLFNQLAVDKN